MIRFSARGRAREERSAIQRLQDVWESHAKADPLWAIISRPDKKGGKWDLAEFGDYLIELDLVQEGVAWFQDRGSATVTLPVKVTSRADVESTYAAAAAEAPSPAFEAFRMHCIRRAEVLELLHEYGLRLELIEESNCGGPGYQSYFYYARKL